MEKNVEIYLPLDIFDILLEEGVVEEQSATRRSGDSNAGLGRVVSWMTRCDCAILSGWRDSNPRRVNDENNREIQTTLRRYGCGVCKVRGCYTGPGLPTVRENSFFVFEYSPSGRLFDRVKELSERFGQDCFLYKEAGEGKRAFLYGTNDIFGRGRREDAGSLRLSPQDARSYTRVGGGKFTFD